MSARNPLIRSRQTRKSLLYFTLVAFTFNGCDNKSFGPNLNSSNNPTPMPHSVPGLSPGLAPGSAPASTTPTMTMVPIASPNTSAGSNATLSVLSGNPETTYFLNAKVGATSGFNFIIDSGSSDLAIGSSLCKNCSGISPLYNTSTGTNKNVSVSDSYGDGTGWNATEYLDSVTLTGTKAVSMKFAAISAQTYNGAVYNPSSPSEQSFFSPGSEGLLGMAGNLLNGDPTMSAYTDLLPSVGYSPIFTTELCRSSGKMWIGGFDSSVMATPPSYTPIATKNDFFTVNLMDIQMDGRTLGFSTADFQDQGNGAYPVQPIVDTGTSLLILPTAVYKAIAKNLSTNSAFTNLIAQNQALGGAKFFNQDGNDNNNNNATCITGPTMAEVDSQLPHLNLIFPSTTPGQSITVTLPASRSYLYFVPMANVSSTGGTICPGISDGGPGSGTIIGDTALQSLVVVFDRANSRVGFSQDKGCDNNY